jgi:hypothetical protein
LLLGLRRVAASGHRPRDAVGEGVAAQQRLGTRVPGGGRRQGGAGGRLPRRRLLRRHPRHRRGDLRRAGTLRPCCLPIYLATCYTVL